MNKRIFSLLFLSILVFATAFSQSKSPMKKLYAYKQTSVSGVKPGETQKAANNQKPEQSETYNYWFYLEFPTSEKISVTEIWISGKKFTVKTEPVTELPVKKINYTDASGNDAVLMVPFTKNAVLLTYPAGGASEKNAVSKYFSDLSTKYELVITYYWNNKKYYKVAKKITVLQPELRM